MGHHPYNIIYEIDDIIVNIAHFALKTPQTTTSTSTSIPHSTHLTQKSMHSISNFKELEWSKREHNGDPEERERGVGWSKEALFTRQV